MATESSKETAEEQAESLIDDLIRDIFNESGRASESSGRGMPTTAALLEAVIGSPHGASRASMAERMLLAESFAAELADALAPALAEELAPRLMKALEKFTASEAAGRKPASPGRSSSRDRKPDAK